MTLHSQLFHSRSAHASSMTFQDLVQLKAKVYNRESSNLQFWLSNKFQTPHSLRYVDQTAVNVPNPHTPQLLLRPKTEHSQSMVLFQSSKQLNSASKTEQLKNQSVNQRKTHSVCLITRMEVLVLTPTVPNSLFVFPTSQVHLVDLDLVQVSDIEQPQLCELRKMVLL